MPENIDYTSADFWKQYAEYVDERFDDHYKIIMALLQNIDIEDLPWESKLILDLGCGQCQEGKRLFAREDGSNYYGVDAFAEDVDLSGDYRKIELPDKNFSFFCSIFSTEITATGGVNQEFYEMLFNEYPKMQYGIVAGLFYLGKENEEVINVVKDVDTYQSIDYRLSSVYKETRMIVHGPSKLFGNEEMEVWKLLERR